MCTKCEQQLFIRLIDLSFQFINKICMHTYIIILVIHIPFPHRLVGYVQCQETKISHLVRNLSIKIISFINEMATLSTNFILIPSSSFLYNLIISNLWQWCQRLSWDDPLQITTQPLMILSAFASWCVFFFTCSNFIDICLRTWSNTLFRSIGHFHCNHFQKAFM